jgi:hypothetical protein
VSFISSTPQNERITRSRFGVFSLGSRLIPPLPAYQLTLSLHRVDSRPNTTVGNGRSSSYSGFPLSVSSCSSSSFPKLTKTRSFSDEHNDSASLPVTTLSRLPPRSARMRANLSPSSSKRTATGLFVSVWNLLFSLPTAISL